MAGLTTSSSLVAALNFEPGVAAPEEDHFEPVLLIAPGFLGLSTTSDPGISSAVIW